MRHKDNNEIELAGEHDKVIQYYHMQSQQTLNNRAVSIYGIKLSNPRFTDVTTMIVENFQKFNTD